MQEGNFAIGIDLGTTNSAIAVWREGKVELIPNALGEYLTPSVVSIDEKQNVLIGAAAKARLLTKPNETASAFKRFLGSNKTFQFGNQEYTPTELSALILRSLKADAENYLQIPVRDVVISVPAYFNDQQRKLVRYSAELAGLNAVRLINEPTAACLAYSLHEMDPNNISLPDDRRYMVFDLGGGTFDVTIVEFSDNFIEVRASTGNNRLGGEDFTDDLVNAVCNKLQLVREQLSPSELAKISCACEQGKCQRSDVIKVQLSEPFNQSLVFEQKELDGIWQKTLSQISLPLRQALRDSRMALSELDDIIFVGGATRLRDIQQMATRLLGRFPRTTLDPDLVVCMGATIQAACRLRDQSVEEIILTDVCPFSLGIATQRQDQKNIFSPIIERNTVIPCSRVERYYTVSDQQRRIHVDVYQGERLDVHENILIDSLDIAVLPKPAGEEAIDVRFSYDINGLLEIDVKVLSTGESIQKVIDQTPRGLSDDEKKASHERLSRLKVHPRDELPNLTLLEKLNRCYEETLGDERDWIGQLLLDFYSVLDRQNKDDINLLRWKIENEIKIFHL